MSVNVKEEVKELVELRKLVSSATQKQFFDLILALKKKGKLTYSEDAIEIVKMMYDVQIASAPSRFTC